jgi:hypothetical protein
MDLDLASQLIGYLGVKSEVQWSSMSGGIRVPIDGSLGMGTVPTSAGKSAGSLMSQPESPHGMLRVQYILIYSPLFSYSILFLCQFPSCILFPLFVYKL